jgi:hypothetical protein
MTTGEGDAKKRALSGVISAPLDQLVEAERAEDDRNDAEEDQPDGHPPRRLSFSCRCFHLTCYFE